MPHEYFTRAAAYAAHRPHYPAQLADWLAGLAPRRDAAWDAGCGSGQLSVLLGDRFARVVASDATPAQVRHAGAHARVSYVVALAEAAPLRDGSVDLAVAAQAAHWFDLPRYWSEVRRVARRGAAVALVGYDNAIIDGVDVHDRFVRFHREEVGSYWPPERQLIEDAYRTIAFPFDEIESPHIEIRESWTADQMLGYIGTWSALRRFEKGGGDVRVIEDFARELRELWGPRERLVRWPMPLRAGRV